MLAAGGVAFFHSLWPDVLVGAAVAVLFLRTAWTVLREAMLEYREHRLEHAWSVFPQSKSSSKG